MNDPTDLAALVGRTADERLLGDGMTALPEAERPQRTPPARDPRGALVAVGTALTGVSLLGGVALVVLGVVAALAGHLGGREVAAIALGAALVATHWGWVHVAEATADALEARREAHVLAAGRAWLAGVEAFTRYSVATSVLADGSIRIARTRHRPVAATAGTFTFVREPDAEEVHAAHEPGAAVAERAESLRRQAALDTERERRRWRVAADAYDAALFDRDDEQQRLAARRAASLALSDEINERLREPPLVE